MNQDDNNPGEQGGSSGELEARITAWVAGEASAAEAAELERLAAENPEIAALRRRIEGLARLVAESVSPDREPMRLSKSRRAELLRVLRAPPATAAAASGAPLFPSLEALRRRQAIERRWILAVAACATCGVFLLLVVQPSFQRAAERRTVLMSAHAEAQAEPRKALLEKKERAAAEESQALFDVARNKPSDELALQMPAVAPPDEAEPSPPTANPAAPPPPGVVAGARRAPAYDFAQLRAGPAPSAVGAGKQAIEEQREALSRDIGAIHLDLAANNRAALASGGAAPAGEVSANLAPPSGDLKAAPSSSGAEEPAALSPFVADASKDKGSYKDSSTLAGAPARSDLEDVASGTKVVTAQFLQDTGVTNEEDLLAYAPGTEPYNRRIAAEGTPSAAAGAAAPAEPDAERADRGPRAKAEAVEVPAETSASREPVSTFSLHVSDASFRLALGALSRGEMPDAGSIRPEEFYNAFSYGDPAPSMAEKVSCRTEQSADPTMQQRNLLRIAMAVPATGRGAAEPLRLTVLLDTSGSMEREDRAAAVARAMQVLVSLLGRDDRVTLVGFARQPRLIADQVPGDKAGALLDVIRRTPAQGGTNIEEAIKLAGELALRQLTPGAQNRIVLLTDGAANLGDADPAHLGARVEALRQKGLSFDACGVGTNGIDDSVLEALTRKGSGRYYVLDTPEAADAGFARQLAGALRPAAENVKVQVRFNPARVGNYRLVGFERHRLRKEDFRNDAVAAAALAAGEAAVALYEVEALPQGEGELGEVYVRFRDTASGAMVERSWTLPYDPNVPAFDRATPTLQLAGTAAFLAEKLRGGARAEAIKLAPLAPVVAALRGHYAHEARVQELAAMYERMRRMRME